MIPGLGRFPGEGKGYPLQYSGLKNSMDCIVHGVSKSWTRLSDCHFHLLNHTLQISLWLIFGELMFNFRACICQYPYGARLDCVARLLCCCLVISHIGLSPTPMDSCLSGSSVHGISQARILDGLPFPSPGDLPNPGIEPSAPELADELFTAEPPGKPSSVQAFSRVLLFATLWIAACQDSLSITNSWSLLKLVSIESLMPSNHFILCCPLLLPSVFPSIRVFSNESALHIRWPKY